MVSISKHEGIKVFIENLVCLTKSIKLRFEILYPRKIELSMPPFLDS